MVAADSRRAPMTRPVMGALAALVGVTLAACSAGSSVTGASSTASTGTGTSNGIDGSAGSTGASTGSSAGSAGTLTLGLVAEPPTLDITSTDAAAVPQVLRDNVYEGLVKLDQSGAIVPALASRWTVSPDRKTYTFSLLKGVTFSNGSPFTAADAAFSIEKAKTWTNTKGKTAMAVVASATATGADTLVVKLNRPSNSWLYTMTLSPGVMFSRTGVADLATKPIGTGPYIVSAWNRGDSITLTRNPGYHGQAPAFEKVVFRYIKDPTALNNALLSGAIDVITTVQAPEALGQFTGNDSYQVLEGTTNGEVLLSFNNARAPFDDVRVRKAARQAIDHKALLDTCWSGRGTLIGSMVPPTDPWYEDLTGVAPYNPDVAKALLAQAGKANPSVRLRIPNLPYAVSCGQVVKSMLERVGFRVTLDQLEFPAAWLTNVFTGSDYEMSIVAHVEPRDLPSVFGNRNYYVHYANPALAPLLTKADTGTEAEQIQAMKQAARLISEDAASDWLFLLPNLMVAKKDITGLPKNAVGESLDLSGLGRN